MYQLLGIANFEDRFVIPTTHEEMAQEDPYAFQGQSGFTPGNISSQGATGGREFSLFPTPRKRTYTPQGVVPRKKD
jgi:nitrate reductase beta subunit